MIANLLWQATLETLYMSLISTALAFIIGLGLAVVLVLSRKGGLMPNPALYRCLDIVVNTLRSFPFIY